MYLPDLISYLSENLEGFKQERKDTQRLIARILYLPHTHYQDESAVAIPCSFLRELGHSTASFNRVNEQYGFYSTNGSYVKGKQSRKYYPNPIVNTLLHGFASQSERKVIRELFKDVKGNYCERTAEWIADKMLKVGGLKINPCPKVNVVEFAKYIAENPDMPKHRHDTCMRFLCLLHSEQYPDECIPQAYHQIPNGRVTGLGVALQNAPKGLRKALLKGYWEYDFQNAHYSILSQTGNYPTIKEYVDNTKEWRNTLANDLGITVKEAKKCLLAMSYGATKGTNPKFCAIPAIIGVEKTIAFWKHPRVVALSAESKIAGSTLTGLPAYDKGLAVAVSNKLQGIEHEILTACTKDLIITLPIYDGFIYPDNLDVNELQTIIKEATGYSITVTKERV